MIIPFYYFTTQCTLHRHFENLADGYCIQELEGIKTVHAGKKLSRFPAPEPKPRAHREARGLGNLSLLSSVQPHSTRPPLFLKHGQRQALKLSVAYIDRVGSVF